MCLDTKGSFVYCSSKYALEAFNDVLRRELRSFNISVSMINPGYVQSSIFGKSEQRLVNEVGEQQLKGVYSEFYEKIVEKRTRWAKDNHI